MPKRDAAERVSSGAFLTRYNISSGRPNDDPGTDRRGRGEAGMRSLADAVAPRLAPGVGNSMAPIVATQARVNGILKLYLCRSCNLAPR
jgi:hypothetical protein